MDDDELDLMMDHTRFDEVDEHTAQLAKETVELLRKAQESNEPCRCDEDDIAPEDTPGFTEWLANVAREASRKAAQETLDAGRPITIAQDGYIVRKYPDGHIERIKKLPPALIITEDRYVAEEQPDGTFKKLHKLPDCITVCKR